MGYAASFVIIEFIFVCHMENTRKMGLKCDKKCDGNNQQNVIAKARRGIV